MFNRLLRCLWRSAALLGCAVLCLGAAAGGDPADYDRYAGPYQFAERSVMTVKRDGKRLLLRITGQPAMEIVPLGNAQFFAKLAAARVTFEIDAQGDVSALVLRQSDVDYKAPRIAAALARRIEGAVAARALSKTPQPGSEAALRRLYTSLLAGRPNYEEMSPNMQKIIREQLPKLQAGAQRCGAIQSMEFRGVGTQGWDLYEIRHEHAVTTWRISLSSQGKIDGAMFAGP